MKHLDDIEARLKAATPGPWEWLTHDMAGARWSLEGRGEGILTCAAMLWPDETNADFIASAPDDLTRTTNALRAIERRLKLWESTFTGRAAEDTAIRAATYMIRNDITEALQGEQ